MTLGAYLKYLIWLGSTCFGGPLALVSTMQKNLVLQKKWFSDYEFDQGFMLSQITPGPLATQVAIYLGWLRFGFLGSLLGLLGILLPAFLLTLFFANLYVHYENVVWIKTPLMGVNAVVVGLVSRHALRMTKRSVGKTPLFIFLAVSVFLIRQMTPIESVILLPVCGLISVAYFRRHDFNEKAQRYLFLVSSSLWQNYVGLFALTTQLPDFKNIFLFFMRSGALVFGGGLAILPTLQHGLVDVMGWVTHQEFMDALAIAMLTPGPLLIIVTFLGFLVDGYHGALTATLGTFLPCFVITSFLAPKVFKFSKFIWLKHLACGIIAGVVGAIWASVLSLTQEGITSPLSAVLAIIAFVVAFKTKKNLDPLLILCGALCGFLFY